MIRCLKILKKNKKTVLDYSEKLMEGNVTPVIVFNNAEYQMDRFFAEELRKQAKMLLDAPSYCPMSDTFKQYASVLKEYATAVERKWIFAGNELRKIADNETVSSVFEPIKEDYENKIRSLCEVCRVKHENEK